MIARRPRQPIFAPKTRDDLFPITPIKPVRLHPELESQLPEQRNPFKYRLWGQARHDAPAGLSTVETHAIDPTLQRRSTDPTPALKVSPP
jgi:hypothetical protein